MGRRIAPGWLTIGAGAIALVAGCQHPEIQRRMARREAVIQDVFETAERMEARRPASIEQVWDAARAAREKELRRTPRNFEALADWFAADARRFESRLDDYEAQIAETFRGHPERAWDPLLILF